MLITIVGAGPAGLFAAEYLAERGHKVTIFEQLPSPARKLLMAGRGGLNITHSEPLETFLTRYSQPAPSLTAAVGALPPTALVAWANGLGQETFTGSSGRIFPKSLKASPLLRAWLRRLDALGVELKTGERWTGWESGGGLRFENKDGTHAVRADAVLLALGGASWPRLGSDGRWAAILAERGVAIAPLQPANAGVRVAWSDYFRDKFAGQPLKRIAVSCGDEHRRGEALITKWGLEGGAVYGLTPHIRSALEAGQPAELMLDLKPDMELLQLAARLSGGPKKQSVTNWLRKAAALPPPAIALLREHGRQSLPTASVALAHLIKTVPIPVTALGDIDRAISTAGGISQSEIDGGFMLKALPGVFVAGEMLDWEAPTGGYLLQGVFATGLAAAKGIERWLGERG